MTRLAALPSREVLLAKLAGGMQAPIGDPGRAARRANMRNLGYALAQVAEQKAQRRRRLTGARTDDHPTAARRLTEGDTPWQS